MSILDNISNENGNGTDNDNEIKLPAGTVGTALKAETVGTSLKPVANELPSSDRISDLKCRELIREAIRMLKYSYAPYSDFNVGAALLTKSNKIFGGCNIENAAFTPGSCAERTAIYKAVSEGERDFAAIAIVGGKNGQIKDFCAPCGVCRQVMREFCDPDAFYIILARSEDDYWVYTLGELLPMSFGPSTIS